MQKLEQAGNLVNSLKVERPYSEPGIYLGTSAFTAAGWEGSFYPRGMQSRDFLTYYATQFRTVEVDSTFYRIPSASTVTGWYERAPTDFVFAAKVPQATTHEKVLVGARKEFEEFVDRMDILDEKLGPLLLQFPYFNKKAFPSVGAFLERLRFFLRPLRDLKTCRFAVEIRNRNWLDARFADMLRENNVVLVLSDQAWMPRPLEYFEKFDPITADFTYIRWLGDRRGIEERTKTWDKTIIDRTRELEEWVEACRRFNQRNIAIFAFVNNHYAGHAPATAKLFQELWKDHSKCIVGE